MHQPIIIGGGVSGLIAAIHLAERGVEPILLEADPDWIGGRLKNGPTVSFEHKGRVWQFAGEHAVHGLWSPYVNLKAILDRYEILSERVPAVEETWIYGRGRRIRKAPIGSAIRNSYVPAPFHYLQIFLRPRFLNMLNLRDIASMFRVVGGLFAAMSIDPLKEQKSLTGMSLADFMAGWSPTIKSLFAGLTRNALAAHPEEVPAAGFIAFLRFYTVLRRDAWRFDYLPGTGGSCIAEPLAKKATQLGCEIRMGVRAVSLESGVDGARWEVTCEGKNGRFSLPASHLILAVDAPAAKSLLNASDLTKQAAETLYFPTGVPTAIIRLWFKRKPKQIAEAGIFTGDFIVDNFFWLDRLQPDYRLWGEQTNGSAIEMHIYGPPELLAQPDAALLAQVIHDAYRAFPELRNQLLHSELLRNRPTHTLFGVGEPGHHLGIETAWPGLFVCGDWVYHPAPALYLERATTTGVAAANALLEELDLEPWPILSHPVPEWLAGKLMIGAQKVRQLLLARKRAKADGASNGLPSQ